jgi:integrase
MIPRFFYRKNKDLAKDGKLMCVFKLSDFRGKEYSQEFDTGIFISRAQYDLDHSKQKADVTATLQILQSHLVVKLGRPCTAFELKEAYLNRNTKQAKPAPVVLVCDVFAAFLDGNRHKNANTQKVYKHYLLMLQNTCAWLPQLPAAEMDSATAERIYKDIAPKYKPQTCILLLAACNTALNYAIRAKMIVRNNFADFKPKPPKTEIVFLTDAEVEMLKNAPSCAALDLFLLMIETGLSYIDTQNFRMNYETHDGVILFTGKRQKTDGTYFGRLSETAQNILTKYGNKPPKIAYHNFHKHLKIAIKACGIEKNITGHKARHTLAARVIRQTGNMSLVADMLGDTVATVQNYYGKMTVKGFAEKLKKSGM